MRLLAMMFVCLIALTETQTFSVVTLYGKMLWFTSAVAIR
jgi:hypothetical protein